MAMVSVLYSSTYNVEEYNIYLRHTIQLGPIFISEENVNHQIQLGLGSIWETLLCLLIQYRSVPKDRSKTWSLTMDFIWRHPKVGSSQKWRDPQKNKSDIQSLMVHKFKVAVTLVGPMNIRDLRCWNGIHAPEIAFWQILTRWTNNIKSCRSRWF